MNNHKPKNRKRMAVSLLFVAILAVGGFFLLFRPAEKQEKFKGDFLDTFDTYTTLTAYSKNQKEFDKYYDIIHNEMKRLHELFDIYNDYPNVNNIKTINDNAGITPTKVSPEIITLLEESKKIYEETNGAVNVALGPVLRVWHDYREKATSDPSLASVPSMDILETASLNTDLSLMEIDKENSTVFLPSKNMSLDVGAIAKGFASRAALDLAQDQGLKSALLNAGGSIYAISSPQDGRSFWSIAIQDPQKVNGEDQSVFDILKIKDLAVATSGDYQRFYQVGDVSYHHIIDPHTLMPAKHVRGASIICNDPMLADALSTAAFILPKEQAISLLNAHKAQGILIYPDGTCVCTDGYSDYSENFSSLPIR